MPRPTRKGDQEELHELFDKRVLGGGPQGLKGRWNRFDARISRIDIGDRSCMIRINYSFFNRSGNLQGLKKGKVKWLTFEHEDSPIPYYSGMRVTVFADEEQQIQFLMYQAQVVGKRKLDDGKREFLLVPDKGLRIIKKGAPIRAIPNYVYPDASIHSNRDEFYPVGMLRGYGFVVTTESEGSAPAMTVLTQTRITDEGFETINRLPSNYREDGKSWEVVAESPNKISLGKRAKFFKRREIDDEPETRDK